MMRFRAVSIVAVGVLVLGLASVALGMKEQAKPLRPPDRAVGAIPMASPFIMVQQGDTTWIQVHANESNCPGDPLAGHGGEATGGPDGSETWCLEGGVGDTCGTVAPWDTKCFTYVDVRSLPSQVGINYWHIDSYRTDQRAYTGSRALWCGSGETWDGKPVECGTWTNAPGYGNYWNCVVQLSLPADFTVANGCTVYFDPRYDTECKYDYFYLDYNSGTGWQTLGTFNATSNDPGDPCGGTTTPNPDNWGNSDVNRLNLCNWQERAIQNQPAFKGIITPAMLAGLTQAPAFRWRFVSDGNWSDADGQGDSDGGAFVDNVWIRGDAGDVYTQDFESSSISGPLPTYWSFEDPLPVAQCWHIRHDPDPPYEGGDGGARTTCLLDSSWVWRGRPEGGYSVGAAWRNGWFYRIESPSFVIQNTGCVVEYDQYMCANDYTCDYTNTRVRFYDGDNELWCPWVDIDSYILYGGCFFWNFDLDEDVTTFYGASADSMQFGWELLDVSAPSDFCRGKHGGTENIIDNVSVGFYDGNAAQFTARGIDILQDSFLEEVAQAYNSFFAAYKPDSIAKYSGPGAPPLPKTQQMYLDVSDKDNLASVEIVGSIDAGQTWVSRAMTLAVPSDPAHPEVGGEYYGTLEASDFNAGATAWDAGTECWYYIRATDDLSNVGYFPARADPSSPQHQGGIREDYFGFSIMPLFPPTYTGVKILLVDGMNQNIFDYGQCVGDLNTIVPPEDIYEATLRDAGYCYDKYDISGAGSNQHIHPLQLTDYDAIVWFTGPYFSNYLFDKEAQQAIKAYLASGGKVVLCGDRIAYNMSVVGEDSLGGEFLAGIMGCTYQEEMESPFTKPFVYAEAAPTVNVFGSPVAIPLDSVVVYRECPYLKDMSYVETNTSPPGGYVVQELLDVLNTGPTYNNSDGAVYVEYNNAGQCVYVNFDLSAVATHTATYCSGTTPDGAPEFDAGYYYGRVDLMRVILYNLFGLPPLSGGGGTSGVEPPKAMYQWALSQNSPNPLTSGTRIDFEVARTSDVSIKVYNAMGQLVQVLKDGRVDPGRYSVAWDGRNQAGERVSSGVYFYKMEGDRFFATKKMLVVK
jgi:hypothetical protein